jgi:hypothetical protein
VQGFIRIGFNWLLTQTGFIRVTSEEFIRDLTRSGLARELTVARLIDEDNLGRLTRGGLAAGRGGGGARGAGGL